MSLLHHINGIVKEICSVTVNMFWNHFSFVAKGEKTTTPLLFVSPAQSRTNLVFFSLHYSSAWSCRAKLRMIIL